MTEETTRSFDPTTLGSKEEDPNVIKDELGNVLPSFDRKYEDDFTGLLYIGALQSDFEWLGHRITIRTLRDGELLAIGQIIKPYQDTVGGERAYANAIAALAVLDIDGNDLPIPIGETSRVLEWAKLRFDYVRDHWYSSTVDEIYNRYIILADKANRVVEALGKASAPVESTPMSSDI